MKLALPLILVALTTALAFPASPAFAEIELTEADPADGARIDVPPEMVHLCFSEPVIINDNTRFSFRYVLPDGRSLGLRIVFQPGGECVNVFPGMPDNYPAGEHTLRWQVAAAESDEEGSGEVQFEVTEGGTQEPSPSRAPVGTPEAETPAAGTPPAETPADETPEAGTPTAMTPTPEGGGADTADADDDDGPDILLLALITIGVAGGAAMLFTLGYLVRRRIGYEPHRPPEGGEGDEGH